MKMRGVPCQRDVTNLEQPNFTEGSHGASKRLNPALAGWLATGGSGDATSCAWETGLYIYIYVFMSRTYDGARVTVAFSPGPLSSSDTHQPTQRRVNLLSVIFCKPRTSSGVTTALLSRSSSVVTGTPTSAELQPFFTFIAAVCLGLPSVPPVSPPGLSPAAFWAPDGSWLLPLLVQE